MLYQIIKEEDTEKLQAIFGKPTQGSVLFPCVVPLALTSCAKPQNLAWETCSLTLTYTLSLTTHGKVDKMIQCPVYFHYTIPSSFHGTWFSTEKKTLIYVLISGQNVLTYIFPGNFSLHLSSSA